MVDVARNGRSEDQILGAMAGHVQSGLVVTLGGETRYIRPLSIKAERVWRESVGKLITLAAKNGEMLERLGQKADEISPAAHAADIAALIGDDVEDVLALVLEFDHLGGGTLAREWMEESVAGVEIRNALEVLLASVFPRRAGASAPAPMILGLILTGSAARVALATSTSGSSPGTRGSTVRPGSKKR